MAIVGYDPLPNGLTRFRKDDGSSMAFQGPEADRLRAWVDQTRPPDARMAQNDGGLALNPDGSLPGPGSMSGRAQTRTDALPPPVEPPKSQGPTWGELGQFDASGKQIGPPVGVQAPAEPMGFGPPQGQPQTPAQSARVASSPPVPSGAPPGPHATPTSPGRVEAPGNPGELPAMAGLGGSGGASDAKGALGDAVSQLALATATEPIAHGRGTPAKLGIAGRTIEGAGPEDRAANADMLATQRTAQEASVAEYRAAAEQKRAYFEQEQAAAAHSANAARDQMLEAQNHATAVQQAWDKTYSGLQREQDAAANQKIDPKRLFSGDGGTFQAIMSTLGVALGAFGAGMTGGPNYALQIVNSSIERDINAQSDAIHRRGENANNAMTNFMRAYGMQPEEAKLAVKSIGQQYAGSLAQIQAAKLGSANAQEEAAKFAAQMQNDSLKTMAEAQAKLQARVSETYKMQGGSGGGDTPEKRLARLKTAAEIQLLEDKHAGNKGGGKLSARLGAQQSVNEAAQADLVNASKHDPGGYVLPDLPVVPRTQARIDLETQATAIVGKVVAGMNGSVNQEEMKELHKLLADPRESVRKAAMARAMEGMVTSGESIERQRGNSATLSTGEAEPGDH